MSVAEKVVEDFERAILGKCADAFLTVFTPKLSALIADWRKRGEALERMTEYAAELETAIGAILTQQQQPAASPAESQADP